MRKKVLVVAMLNSIHTAKWLTQFKDCELDIYIFPSTYFKRLHPQIEELLTGSYACSFTISGPKRIVGLLDYLTERVFSKKITFFERSERLNRAIRRSNPAIVHALEFQHAGYICLTVIEKHGKRFELISTNWGSDIFHFRDLPAHQEKIRRLLSYSDKYSSECERDVALALELGFAWQPPSQNNPFNAHISGWRPCELRKLGFRKIRGHIGSRLSYGPYGLPRKKIAKWFFLEMLAIDSIITSRFASASFSFIATKKEKSPRILKHI